MCWLFTTLKNECVGYFFLQALTSKHILYFAYTNHELVNEQFIYLSQSITREQVVYFAHYNH